MRTAINLWYDRVTSNEVSPGFTQELRQALLDELPTTLSWVGERTCNLQCGHCIFQNEHSSQKVSRIAEIELVVPNIASQYGSGSFVHEGRILSNWHVPVLQGVREVNPDMRVGLIDNGTYLRVSELRDSRFQLDWLDISIDGTEAVHNIQRRNDKSYAQALLGLQQAPKYARKVTSLFTATKLNYHNLLDSVKKLFASCDQLDELYVIPISPTRPDLKLIECDEREFSEVWSQIKKAHELYPGKIFFRMYRGADLQKFAHLIGSEKFREAFFEPANVWVGTARIDMKVDGVQVSYFPLSIGINETTVIDADGYYRAPYSIAFTLAEHMNGISATGQDLRAYTIAKLTPTSRFSALYEKGVRHWLKNFAMAEMDKEERIIKSLRS
jgi:MoaA/NifB/PqqE/SkfB family radical SAM enzyme